jgi:DNA primase
LYYSDEIIEEVRSRNDIVDVISGYVKLKKKGNSYFGLCPFHNEKSPSFSVSRDKQMYYCFGCGAGGNVFTFLREYENYTFQEALKTLAERAGIDLPEVEYSEEAKKQADLKASLLEINKEAAKYYYYQLRLESGKAAYDYLRKRKLTDETIKKFGLGYSSKYSNDLYQYLKHKGYSDGLLRQTGLITYDEKRGIYDKFWNRAMFPIMDVNHRVIGFGGRVMGEGNPKYLNSPETVLFDKSRNLYGLNFARSSRRPNLIICEGYMDVIALHQAGFNNAVASLGTAFTSGQASLLKRYTDEVLVTYDSDEAGVKAALRAIPILREAGLTARVIRMTPYKDPDEFIKNLGKEAFEERINQATNSFIYEIEVHEKEYDLKDPDGKTAFYHYMAKRLVEFEDEIERTNYIEALARKYHIEYENLKKQVNRYGSSIIPNQAEEIKRLSIHKKNEKEDGANRAQKLLLTWLAEEPSLFDKLRGVIEEEDFTVDNYRKAASMMFSQFKEGETINPARILDAFAEEEEQREISSLFYTKLDGELGKMEKEKAINEIIYRVKKNHLDEMAKTTQSIEMLQEIVKKQAALRQLHISLD